eukprot:TRINITY_DN5076_c0_g2_i6.p1 TRINITY_DN5076_c0_g2~~TRINITY_DN5076_c0_g2_i6.p1  ORF type:complete len:712 (-),score=199.56 TRINITY_DN5076_c0_g2_i6:278-2413(-)
MEELQKLFAFMIKSKRKYISPKTLSETIVDENGRPVQLGDQKDVEEFNINFLARVDEAISAQNSSVLRSTLKSQMSLGPKGDRTSLVIQGESFVSRSFFGKQLITTHAVDSKNNPIEIDEEMMFGQVLINPRADNIYQGWDDNAFSEVDDFVTHDGMKTKAQQESWILKPPNALFLQIQRAAFDKSTCQLKKVTHPVQFDKVIYIDRFLERNKKRSLEIRKQVLVLKTELKKKKEQLKDFIEFGKQKRSLLETLDGTLEFLEAQHTKCAGTAHEHLSQGNLDSHLPSFISITKGYIKSVTGRIGQLYKQIENIKDRITSAYGEMRDTPYELHAIWAHSGVPESGHYIAYVHDKNKNKWRKCNDRVVKEEDESNIFPALKDIANTPVLADAYCLLYVRKDIPRKGEGKASILPVNAAVDDYSKLLTPALEKFVAEDNKSLDTEIAAYKKRQLAATICTEYNYRIQQLQSFLNKLGCETFNFISYLYYSQNNLWKWELLDKIVRKVRDDHVGLGEMQKEEKLMVELNRALASSNAPVKVIELSPAQINMLRVAKEDYRAVIFDWMVQKYVLEKIISKEWMKAVDAIALYFVQASYMTKRNYERMNDIAKILALRLVSCVSEKLMEKKVKEVITYIDTISVLCIKYIPRDDPHTRLITKVLSSVINNTKSLFTQEEFARAEELIQRIREFPLILHSKIPKDYPDVSFCVSGVGD